MENKNFDFMNFLKEQENINKQLIVSNQFMGNALKSIKEDAIDTLTKQVGDMRTTILALENNIKTVLDENKNIKEDNEKLKNDMNIVKDNLNTLEFEDSKTLGEVKKKARSRITYLLGGADTPQYKILFQSCIMQLYSKIGDVLCGGKRIGKVKVEDGKGAISIARNYHLDNNKINKRIKDLQKQQKLKLLSEEQSIALDLTAEWMEERIYG